MIPSRICGCTEQHRELAVLALATARAALHLKACDGTGKDLCPRDRTGPFDGCWPCQHYPNPPCPLPYPFLTQNVDSKKRFILLNYLYLFPPCFLRMLHSQASILNLCAPSAVSFILPLGFIFSITALPNPHPSLLSM